MFVVLVACSPTPLFRLPANGEVDELTTQAREARSDGSIIAVVSSDSAALSILTGIEH